MHLSLTAHCGKMHEFPDKQRLARKACGATEPEALKGKKDVPS